MIGMHQQSNMAIAITALLISGFKLVEPNVQAAVKKQDCQVEWRK